MSPKKPPSQAKLNSQLRQVKSAAARAKRDVTKAQGDLKRSERQMRAASRTPPRVTYSSSEQSYLGQVHQQAERQAQANPDKRDVFLCHACGDRHGAARELHTYLGEFGVDVWFSEEDVPLGTPLLQQIDKGLRMSRIGLVLVTPNMLKSLANERGVAGKELAALLATERVVPVAHGVTYEVLSETSPLLASRSGLSTEEDTLEEVAAKIAETVSVSR